MIIKDEMCPLTNEECENIQACKYSIGRFGINVCSPYRKKKTEQVHKQELEARKQILKVENN